jgi:hypothetical protein
VLASLLIGLGVAVLLYFKRKKASDVSQFTLIVLAGLRFLSTTLVILFLLNIFFKQRRNETQNPIILLAIDNSSSMVAAADSTFVKKEFLEKIDQFKRNLSEKYTVRTVLFGEKIITGKNPDFSEKETDMEDLVKDLNNSYAGENIGALVIASDGIYNKGANPVYAAEKFGCPVYALAMGDTTEMNDVLIRKINHNQVAYLGNNFPVEVIINAKKYAGKEVNVSLFNNGIEKVKNTLKITNGDFLATSNFTLNASATGLVKYTAKVTVLEGEKNTVNNSGSFVIDVIDNREKVLLLGSAPHPDLASLKEVISNGTSFELDYSLFSDFKKPLKPYSLVIFHGFSNTQTPLLTECKNLQIPFWMINPTGTDNLPGLRLPGGNDRTNDVEPVFDATFSLFTISPELKSLIKELPAVNVPFGNYKVANNAISLINQRVGDIEIGNPILIFTDISGLKAGLFVGDGLWKWKMRDYAEHNNYALFQELISKCVQYLSVKSDKSFFRLTAPKIVNENEAIDLTAEVYNKSYELITDPDVSLVLSGDNENKYNYTFNKTSNAYQLNIGRMPPGEYKYTASTKINGELLVKQGLIIVKEVIAEKINSVANHQLLYQMANRTNGKVYEPKRISELEADLLKNDAIKPVVYSQISTSNLIDFKWLIWLIIGLLSIEWFLRKRFFSI